MVDAPQEPPAAQAVILTTLALVGMGTLVIPGPNKTLDPGMLDTVQV